jgi:preprotein translocase SecE subunit
MRDLTAPAWAGRHPRMVAERLEAGERGDDSMAEQAQKNWLVRSWEGTGEFFAGVKFEMAKGEWPSGPTVRKYTAVVLVSTILISSLIGLMDVGLTVALEWLLKATAH